MNLLSPNLQAFLTVYRHKTLLAAARELGIGQTGVTQRIKSLEQDVGTSLFLRSRKGMELTAEGRALLRHCQLIQESEGRLVAEIKDAGRVSAVDIRISGPTSFISGRVVPRMAAVFKKWPMLNIHFMIDDAKDRTSLLKSDQSDIVVLYPHQVALEFDSKVLRPDEYCLLGHPSWKGRALTDILEHERLFAFHAEDETSLNYLKTYGLLKHLKRPRLFVNENHALITLLTEGVGFGLLLKEIAEPLLRDKKLILLNEGKLLKDPLALAWYPRAQMPKYFKDVLAVIHR